MKSILIDYLSPLALDRETGFVHLPSCVDSRYEWLVSSRLSFASVYMKRGADALEIVTVQCIGIYCFTLFQTHIDKYKIGIVPVIPDWNVKLRLPASNSAPSLVSQLFVSISHNIKWLIISWPKFKKKVNSGRSNLQLGFVGK